MVDIVERNEVVQFRNGDFVLDVTVDSDNETVWLNREQLSQLFGRDIKTIGKHINNALKEVLIKRRLLFGNKYKIPVCRTGEIQKTA